MSGANSDEQVYPFALVPVEVAMDMRLTLEMIRVLIALYSFRNKHTGLTCPSRESLAMRCGLHPSNISAASTKLVELGWLTKKGRGGYSKPTSYDITVPDAVSAFAALHRARSEAREAARKGETTIAHEATVAQAATVAYGAGQEYSLTSQTTVAHEASSACRSESYTQVTDKLTDKLTDKEPTEFDAPKKSGATEKSPAPTNDVWNAYNTAHFKRYGIDAVRTGKANGQLMELIRRVGKEDAPHIAAFYVAHNNRYYIQKTHTLDALIKDAEGLRTQWATNSAMTSTKATQLDRSTGNRDAINGAIQLLRSRNGSA